MKRKHLSIIAFLAIIALVFIRQSGGNQKRIDLTTKEMKSSLNRFFTSRRVETKATMSVTDPNLKRASSETSAALKGEDRAEVLAAVERISFARKRGIDHTKTTDDLQVLAKYGNAALATIADELRLGNQDEKDDKAMERRLGFIDILGVAASSNGVGRELLKSFATSKLDTSKSARLMHMDLVDKMEAFSLWAKVDGDHATDFIKSVSNKQLKREYIYQLVTGFRLSGMSTEDAAEKAYLVFGQDDLGLPINQQKGKNNNG